MAPKNLNAYSSADGRRFGLTVGCAFLVFAGIAWWRDHPALAPVLGGLGGLLCVAGMAVPAQLGPVDRAWMKLAHLISKVTTPIVMGVMYLLVLTPVGLLRRTLGGNPMVHTPEGDSYWKSRPAGSRAGNLTRQF